MTWFKVDDNLSFHPKALEAGNAALGLWVRAGSWSGANLTNGFIPRAIARQLGTKTNATRLVNAGLWHEVDGGYSFHEWDQRQPTKDDVEAEREANRKRQADYRKRKRQAKSQTDEETQDRHGVTHPGSNGVTSGPRNGVTNGTPTRPDPTITNNSPNAAPLRKSTRANTNGVHAATEWADGTPIPDEPPPSPITSGSLALVPDPPTVIETAARPARVPPPTPAAATLVRNTAPGLPRTVTAQLATQVDQLRRDPNVDNQLIPPALREWASRPGLGPAMLPHLVADAARARAGGTPGRTRPSTTDQRMAEGLALAAKYADQDDPAPTQAALDAARYL